MRSTYHEAVENLDMKNINTTTKGYAVPPRIYEITDTNLMLKSLLLDKVKANITIDDVRLGSNLTINENKKVY